MTLRSKTKAKGPVARALAGQTRSRKQSYYGLRLDIGFLDGNRDGPQVRQGLTANLNFIRDYRAFFVAYRFNLGDGKSAVA
jgi:hypothetical protein